MALLLSAALLTATPPAAPEPLPKAGLFGRGINLEIPALGPAFLITPIGTKTGMSAAAALQFDLGTRLALRLPLDVGTSFGDSTYGFATVGFTPGLLYRFRSDADQPIVPYFGAGLRLMAVGVGRGQLGVPFVTAVTASALSTKDFHDDGDGESNPNFESSARVSPELWLGAEWHPSRWLSVNFAGSYYYFRLLGVPVHTATARAGLRFSF